MLGLVMKNPQTAKRRLELEEKVQDQNYWLYEQALNTRPYTFVFSGKRAKNEEVTR